MKKIIIHIEQITKPSEKFPFQIKIPKGAHELRNIHVTAIAPVDPLGFDLSANELVGDLTLSVPSERNHFYAESVRICDSLVNRVFSIPPPGLSRYADQWIQGTMTRFFGITVKGEDTLIEGFFESTVQWNYELKIYLEFDV